MSSTQAVSDIIKIGHNTAYQLLGRTLRNDQQRFSFKVGLYWLDPKTNLPVIIPHCDLGNYDEQTKARLVAKKHLERHVEQLAPYQTPVQVQVVPQPSVQPTQIPHQPASLQPMPPQGQVQWQQPIPHQQAPQQPQSQALQPPKPYPNGGSDY